MFFCCYFFWGGGFLSSFGGEEGGICTMCVFPDLGYLFFINFLCTSNFSRYCFGQLSPVCAIVGGILGQEIIKVSAIYSFIFFLHFGVHCM